MPPNLIILGIRGVPAAHGGFETFAERLAPYLAERGMHVTVYCQGSDSGRVEHDSWNGVNRVHIPINQKGALGTIEFDIKCVAHVAKLSGVILTLGYNTGFLSVWLRICGRVNIINMDGLEWKRAKYSWPERVYLWMNERLAAWSGNMLIADHPVIGEHLATRAARRKITMIPYGAEPINDASSDLLDSLSLKPSEFFTLIARSEPENSVLQIVRAFSAKRRNKKLVVLGKYDRAHTYQASVLDAASEEVIFPGPIYDKRLLAALRFHSLTYMHGHQVGGTNPSLVEALGAGNAVIAHDNPFNRWVAGDAALYFGDEETCCTQITRLCADDALIRRLQAQSRKRWSEEFTWLQVLHAYESTITKLQARLSC